jgi:hypothetical protein
LKVAVRKKLREQKPPFKRLRECICKKSTCRVAAREEGSMATELDPHLVARIVASYVQHHQVAADQLAGLISVVGQSLAGLGHVAPPEEEEARVPAGPPPGGHPHSVPCRMAPIRVDGLPLEGRRGDLAPFNLEIDSSGVTAISSLSKSRTYASAAGCGTARPSS